MHWYINTLFLNSPHLVCSVLYLCNASHGKKPMSCGLPKKANENISGHYWPASKIQFKWNFAGGPMVVRFFANRESACSTLWESFIKASDFYSQRSDNGGADHVLIDFLMAWTNCQCMRFPTMWYVRPAKPQISLRIRAV